MQAIEIKPDIFWVGAIDWELRNFHGYTTPRGTTYNSYLIRDEQTVLVDTVKHYLKDEMLARIAQVVDPASIDVIVLNHIEMDHAGSLGEVLRVAPNARVLVSPRGKPGLLRYHDLAIEPELAEAGTQLEAGRLSLQFLHTPMVHWPDSMVSYIPQERLLLSNDAFGQHIASSARFDDQLGWDVLEEEAGKYYANIVMPYGDQVNKVMQAAGGLEFDMIAPSHGVIWRSMIDRIVGQYGKWANHQTDPTALIVYDTMWGSTAQLAAALHCGLEATGTHVTVRSLQTSHISEVIADVLTAGLVAIGSPTLNNGMLPTVGGFLTYLKGLRPRNRIGLAFGSHGWGGQGAKEVDAVIRDLGWEVPADPAAVQYRPQAQELEDTQALGAKLGEMLKAR